MCCYLLFAFQFIVILVQAQDIVVNVKQGSVSGTTGVSADGRNFYLFLGIPYAKPPLEDLRFKPPQEPDNWDGIYDATQYASQCIQWSGQIVGDEDCLYINVYTPQLPSIDVNGSLPVLAWIHGGGFGQGNPFITPNGFMDKDVVLVSIAYRLGPLGFFSTGDDASLGNYGMLDQVFALKWIQENVAAFSGDPSRVTIFGESAGGASVAYHVISPASAGLFRGAISESGSTLCPWAFQKDPVSWAIKFAQQLQCPYDNTTDLANCVRQQTAADLVQATQNLDGYNVMVLPFVPVVENQFTGRFLTDYPVHILSQGKFNKVSVISGINKDEGDLTYPSTQQYYTTIDDNFYNNILPQLLYELTKYEDNLLNISYAVKAEYYDKIDVNNQTQVIRTAIDPKVSPTTDPPSLWLHYGHVDNLLGSPPEREISPHDLERTRRNLEEIMNSDPFFKAPNDYTVRKLAAGGIPVYMYVFEYAGSGSHNHYSGEPEVSHGDELYYIFFSSRSQFNEQDLYVSDTMLNAWTNFADHLNPSPSEELAWNPTAADADLSYLWFGSNEISMKVGYLTERMSFWSREVPLIAIE